MISSRVWRSNKFRDLQSNGARLLYLYLHTCSHGNSAGCFHISPALIAAETRIGDVEDALSDLERVGLIRRDVAEDLVSIVGFFRLNSPSSRKQLAGPLAMIEALPPGPVLDATKAELAIALFERATEWKSDVEARGVFLHEAAKLMNQGGKKAIASGAAEADNDLRIALSEALLIALPIQGDLKDQDQDHDHVDVEDHDQDQDHGKRGGDIQADIEALKKKAAGGK